MRISPSFPALYPSLPFRKWFFTESATSLQKGREEKLDVFLSHSVNKSTGFGLLYFEGRTQVGTKWGKMHIIFKKSFGGGVQTCSNYFQLFMHLAKTLFKPLTLGLLFCVGSFPCQGQTAFDLWAQRVNWDGITPWKFYLTIAPGYMGPNALPPPMLQEGRIQARSYIELRPEYYGGRGDQTYDIAGKAYYPIVPGKIGLSAYMVGYEWYRMEPEVRDLRNARESTGSALGDFYFTTIFSLLKDHKSWPDLALDVNLKTASGEQLKDMRYNDAAGYSFNLSFGKELAKDSSRLSVRLHGMLGFYIWQIFQISQQQNDALTYGLGVRLEGKKWAILNNLSGYIGYRDERDRPLQYTMDLHRKGPMLDFGVGYTYGIRDFPYYGLRISTIFYFQK